MIVRRDHLGAPSPAMILADRTPHAGRSDSAARADRFPVPTDIVSVREPPAPTGNTIMATQPSAQLVSTFNALYPTICQLAQRASRRLPWQQRQEFIDEAPAEIFLRLPRYNVQRGPLLPWLGRVLNNLANDVLRRRGRDQRLFQPQHGVEPTYLPDVSATIVEELSAGDLTRLESWPDARERIVLLCISTLWDVVPAAQRQSWSAAAQVEATAVEAVCVLDDVTERIEQVAAVLGVSYTVVQRNWYRKRREQLGKLSRVKNLKKDWRGQCGALD